MPVFFTDVSLVWQAVICKIKKAFQSVLLLAGWQFVQILIHTWTRFISSGALSEPTLRAYRVDLESADGYARSLNRTIDELSDAQINDFIGLLFAEGLKATSIQRKLSALHGFYKYQIRHGHRDDDPMARIHRPSKGRPYQRLFRRATCPSFSKLQKQIH